MEKRGSAAEDFFAKCTLRKYEHERHCSAINFLKKLHFTIEFSLVLFQPHFAQNPLRFNLKKMMISLFMVEGMAYTLFT